MEWPHFEGLQFEGLRIERERPKTHLIHGTIEVWQ